jgi:hypothetical protein
MERSGVSVACRFVACQAHEGIMVSAAYGYERGRRLMQEQETTAGGVVDYIFDIPVEVPAAVCKHRHDRWKYEWGAPQFTRLEVR